MKKLSFLLIAAIAMISCGSTYEIKQVVLTNENDSINYAFGVANGFVIKERILRNDSSEETVTEFIDALQRGYDNKLEKLSEAATAGKNIGHAIKMAEEKGLADVPSWTVNQEIFCQALVNALHHDTTVMSVNVARSYFQAQYLAADPTDKNIGKPVKGKCKNKVKVITLTNQNDSLNYAYGCVIGNDIANYLIATDSTGKMEKEFITYVNKGLKSKTKNPQLVEMGERLGKELKDSEEDGFLGEPSLTTNFELIKQGLINSLLGDTTMTGNQAMEYIDNTMRAIYERKLLEQFGKNKEDGEKFLAENKQKENVITTESGLQYEVIKMGRGEKPAATDHVKVHYHGTLIDGTVFNSSVERGEPITLGLNQVIAGWTEGIQLMPIGSKFKFYIPYELGYGDQQAGAISPYSTLIFEVELLDIEK